MAIATTAQSYTDRLDSTEFFRLFFCEEACHVILPRDQILWGTMLPQGLRAKSAGDCPDPERPSFAVRF